MWHQTGGIFLPKEKNTEQAHSVLSVFLMWKERSSGGKEVGLLFEDKELKELCRKPEFSGCLERSSVIWHQIQAATIEGRDLRGIFGPHSCL